MPHKETVKRKVPFKTVVLPIWIAGMVFIVVWFVLFFQQPPSPPKTAETGKEMKVVLAGNWTREIFLPRLPDGQWVISPSHLAPILVKPEKFKAFIIKGNASLPSDFAGSISFKGPPGIMVKVFPSPPSL